jgi:hypothetical protein
MNFSRTMGNYEFEGSKRSRKEREKYDKLMRLCPTITILGQTKLAYT